MMKECIREGVSIATRNMSLVALHLAASLVNLILFLVFLLLPVLAAVGFLGLDLAHLREMLPAVLSDPSGFFSRYMQFIVLAGLSLMAYLVVTSLFMMYVTAGTLGILNHSALEHRDRFSLSRFFREANRHFRGLFWVVSLLFGLLVVVVVVGTMVGGVIVFLVQSLSTSESALQIFFRSFITVSLFVVAFLTVSGGIIFTMYAMIASVADGRGVMETVEKTYRFLKATPQAFLLFFLLFALLMAVNFLIVIVTVPLSSHATLGPVANVIMSLLSALVQTYLTIVLWSSLTVYYLRKAGNVVHSMTFRM